jgi:hypothetical protein
MKEKYKSVFLNITGVFFLVLGIVATINSVYTSHPTQILYMCYLGLVLIGIGILTRKSFIIMSQIYILAIPLLIWNIDFFYWLIFDKPLWGITDYFFVNKVFNLGKVISLQHLFTVPLSIYVANLIGLKRRDAWKWSFVQIILVFIAVSILSPPEFNINCIFEPCINVSLGLPYELTWFLVIFAMTFLTSIILNYFLINRKNKKK